jgi:hypothetical protein
MDGLRLRYVFINRCVARRGYREYSFVDTSEDRILDIKNLANETVSHGVPRLLVRLYVVGLGGMRNRPRVQLRSRQHTGPGWQTYMEEARSLLMVLNAVLISVESAFIEVAAPKAIKATTSAYSTRSWPSSRANRSLIAKWSFRSRLLSITSSPRAAVTFNLRMLSEA